MKPNKILLVLHDNPDAYMYFVDNVDDHKLSELIANEIGDEYEEFSAGDFSYYCRVTERRNYKAESLLKSLGASGDIIVYGPLATIMFG